MQEKPPPPKQLHAALVSRIKIMADMNIAERFMPQDGHIQINHRGARVDIRVGTMPTIYGESLVMRLLEKSAKVLDGRGTRPGPGARGPALAPRRQTARTVSGHRPDRQRQDHDALFHPAKHLHAGIENSHH